MQRLKGHAICQIFRHKHARHHMVLHDFGEIGDVQHVELAQIHEVHDVGHRLIRRGEQRVRGEARQHLRHKCLERVARLPKRGLFASLACLKQQIGQVEGVHHNFCLHARFGVVPHGAVVTVHPRNVERHHAQTGALDGALSLVQREHLRIAKRGTRHCAGVSIDAVQSLNVDEGHRLPWHHRQAGRGEFEVGHNDVVVGLALGPCQGDMHREGHAPREAENTLNHVLATT